MMAPTRSKPVLLLFYAGSNSAVCIRLALYLTQRQAQFMVHAAHERGRHVCQIRRDVPAPHSIAR